MERGKFKYENLHDDERRVITNGCGAKGGWVKPPQFRFKASCDHHDFGYWRGGDETDRKIADARFFGAMVTDAAMLSWYRRPVHLLLSYVYYRAVRFGGRSAFHYGQKRGWEDLNQEMRVHCLRSPDAP